MINNFALLVSHSLLLLVCWKLIGRGDLDDDGGDAAPDVGFKRPGPRDRA